MEENQEFLEQAQQALAQSWEVHRQAFGPILEPAFRDNPEARILEINALNHISRREIQRGMELLKQLMPFCVCDEDEAAWAFFVGLCFEMAGAKQQMLQWYEQAGNVGHRFYLPYLKLAKAAHGAGQFSRAAQYYETAIGCLLEMGERDRDEVILGSAFTNLTSCLTMLHRYDLAEKIWNQAWRYPQQPGAAATGAILYAAMGDAERTKACLEDLGEQYPQWLEQTETMTRQILAGEYPQFPRE